MAVYRLPLDDDALQHGGDRDDPTGGHGPRGQAYAFDISQRIGGTVRAARTGQVVFVENKAGSTNVDPSVPGYGTAVLIRHPGGTVAAYDHLKYKSTKPSKNQYAFQGEAIAVSDALSL